MLTKKTINDVEISPSIVEDSRSNGYELTNFPQVQQLAAKWLQDKEIEIYTEVNERQFGRLKSTEKDGDGNQIMHYHNVFHARLTGNNDPILIVKLKLSDKVNVAPNLFVAYISDHNQMFGRPYEKDDPRRMREIRTANSDKLP
ncbi:hypothetical protein [Vibrio genomosp. F6]|uniref:Uncharacterized protein n=1 Tax=Vibrio genomosp. F6 str. FF-238 TaxID=1191298 RepID=A0A1E5D5N7_9VIBR|nr:hypothetical protein [Vibrio genomosp. F6]OEE78919.1 hypothetical protein A130_12415 [Vibrio genomosp. F6 str. FF-238]